MVTGGLAYILPRHQLKLLLRDSQRNSRSFEAAFSLLIGTPGYTERLCVFPWTLSASASYEIPVARDDQTGVRPLDTGI